MHLRKTFDAKTRGKKIHFTTITHGLKIRDCYVSVRNETADFS